VGETEFAAFHAPLLADKQDRHMKGWREWPRTTKAECPACHTSNLHEVCKVDATFGQYPRIEPSGPDEVWVCRDCWKHFIKDPLSD
jgi:hypothetical protein